MRAIDLHTHTSKSDGSLTPTELVDLALSKGLAAIAITDHDTVDGIEEAMEYAKDKDIEVIPGIELSTEYYGRDIHVVGLYIDKTKPKFAEHIKEFVNSRHTRNTTMCNKLREEGGLDISYEALMKEFPDSIITRAHYGRYLLDRGYVKSMSEAFDKYLGDHTKYFIPREKISPADAVALILEAGGIPILAHPILYHMTKAQLDTLVSLMKYAGLIGIEAIYSTYKPADEREIRRLADKFDLLISGGSDFHGIAKPGLELGNGYGHLFVPEEVLTKLKEKLC